MEHCDLCGAADAHHRRVVEVPVGRFGSSGTISNWGTSRQHVNMNFGRVIYRIVEQHICLGCFMVGKFMEDRKYANRFAMFLVFIAAWYFWSPICSFVHWWHSFL